jgi:mannitol-1-phosphate 5-dehydrogenase
MHHVKKTWAGFGLGPIQTGLFLLEARQSGNFDRYVVAEVDAALVQAVADAGGRCEINVAARGGITVHRLDGVEVCNPLAPDGRAAFVAALAEADEIATCLPSVGFYDLPGPAGVAGIMADSLAVRDASRPALVYAAENHNHAAEILAERVASRMAGPLPHNVRFLNTVIGKMSGMIADPRVIASRGLAPITPGLPRAVLVESFNRILISRAALPGYHRGIEIFVEKDDLLPFEEAKLYGHNAIHSMVAFLADGRDLDVMSDAAGHADIMAAARQAFIEESGAGLVLKHASLGDPLFTAGGFAEFADDLLERMICPWLYDQVRRVRRDPVRKLGYGDRLFGAMRLALEAGVEPANLALGAAAGVISMIRRREELAAPPANLPQSVDGLDRAGLAALLHSLWAGHEDIHAARLADLTWAAVERLRAGGKL